MRGWRTVALPGAVAGERELTRLAPLLCGTRVPWFVQRDFRADELRLRTRGWLRGVGSAREREPYEPEVARFGGHRAMRVALMIFRRTSRVMLAALSLPLLARGVAVLDAEVARWGVSRTSELIGQVARGYGGEEALWRSVARAELDGFFAKLCAIRADERVQSVTRALRLSPPAAPASAALHLHLLQNRMGLDPLSELALGARFVALWSRHA